MSENQEYGTVARYFINSLPGLGKRATKDDKGPFFTFYRGDFRGAWTNYREDVMKLISHNESKGVKRSFCKSYTWAEVEFVIGNMISFKEVVWNHGNKLLEESLIETFGGWENVHIGRELREEINKNPNPLRPAPNELAPLAPVTTPPALNQPLLQAPSVRTPPSREAYGPPRSSSGRNTPSRLSNKRPLYPSPTNSQENPSYGREGRQLMGSGSNKRTLVVSEDIRTASNVLWTPRSLSMGTTYQIELIDGLIEELSSLRLHFESQLTQAQHPRTPDPRDSDRDYDELLETESLHAEQRPQIDGAEPSSRHAPRARHY